MGSDAFVLGFPVRMYGGEYLPLWKRASVASEPQADVDGLPKTLIDTATRRGMSGSPVFGQVSGLIFPEGVKQTDPDWFGKTYFGLGNRLIGVYSGAYGREPFEAQLGVVWKESAIQQTIRGGKLGTSSFKLESRVPDATAPQSYFDWDDWPFPDPLFD